MADIDKIEELMCKHDIDAIAMDDKEGHYTGYYQVDGDDFLKILEQAERAEKNAQDLEVMDRQLVSEQKQLVSEQKLVRELERGSVDKFLDRLRTLSGTGNGIGASTIARLYILAEREGFLKDLLE